jgi:hypothetical protein
MADYYDHNSWRGKQAALHAVCFLLLVFTSKSKQEAVVEIQD